MQNCDVGTSILVRTNKLQLMDKLAERKDLFIQLLTANVVSLQVAYLVKDT